MSYLVMLADNVETWTDQWKREGREQGREAMRHILVRQVSRRFGATTAEHIEPLLAQIILVGVVGRSSGCVPRA